MSVLLDSSYGKGNVKFLKVKKDQQNPQVQDVLEANCQVLLKGNFDVSYTKADNSPVVPTDTVKNTILVEAKTTDVWPIERFAAHLAKHFTEKYSHVLGVDIKIVQSRWTKFAVNGKLHDHSFRNEGPETRRTHLQYCKKSGNLTITSAIKDLTVLKSTGSMFYGYHQCDYTTLKPATDRILSTDVDASWKYEKCFKSLEDVFKLADQGVFDKLYDAARQITLERFALENSPSVQATMYNMALDILQTAPQIDTVTYELPNKHYILFDLGWKGIKDNKDLFYPSPDPNGLIRCTVGRNSTPKL
ncbi:urate oxidase [Metschnikowia aff. pulcherrima]|uniref:Uricase n=1 Tax=Metschnikowia aff. pulcherrima TaxID=2163413 RepID=A0A4P6XVZ2_9ASCO|nr:urate oxidase [Metschnikowia aff. pulcherrima]